MASSSASSASPPPSPPPPPLSALSVFTNILNHELVRSLHVYGQRRWVEREFLFAPESCREIGTPEHRTQLIAGSAADERLGRGFREGQLVGLWVCVLAFDSASPDLFAVPRILSFSKNPRLKSVPTLAIDLQKVYQLCGMRDEVSEQFASEGICTEQNVASICSSGFYPEEISGPMQPVSADQQNNGNSLETGVFGKKKRAARKHVASISLDDLAKYFNRPITEASRNLKVGVTVLKRKCREYGIPRWPHRKIKSLNTLIHNIQEEVTRQERENSVAAAKAAAKRQRMLELEREGIEQKPCMELQGETKRFRQDVFKRRHRAKAQNQKSKQRQAETN